MGQLSIATMEVATLQTNLKMKRTSRMKLWMTFWQTVVSTCVYAMDDLLHRVCCSLQCFCGRGYIGTSNAELMMFFTKILIEWEDQRRDYRVGTVEMVSSDKGLCINTVIECAYR